MSLRWVPSRFWIKDRGFAIELRLSLSSLKYGIALLRLTRDLLVKSLQLLLSPAFIDAMEACYECDTLP